MYLAASLMQEKNHIVSFILERKLTTHCISHARDKTYMSYFTVSQTGDKPISISHTYQYISCWRQTLQYTVYPMLETKLIVCPTLQYLKLETNLSVYLIPTSISHAGDKPYSNICSADLHVSYIISYWTQTSVSFILETKLTESCRRTPFHISHIGDKPYSA